MTCTSAACASAPTAGILPLALRISRFVYVSRRQHPIDCVMTVFQIWDIAKKRIRNIFDGHQQEIYSLDFSRDGRLIVSGSGDKTARIWDMTDGSTNKIRASIFIVANDACAYLAYSVH